MKVVYGIGNFRLKNSSCVTIGVFDGVHHGHQSILKKVVSFSRRKKLYSVVVTFHPHPDSILKKKKNSILLISLAHRLYLMHKLGIDVCVVIRFNKKFKKVEARKFIKDILVRRYRMKHLFLGRNFLFGNKKRGDINLLKKFSKELGFSLHSQKIERKGRTPISSTLLRSLIQKGNLKQAEKFLGRKVEVIGTVVGGDRLGRRLGFPTANIDPHHEVIPARGVYLIEAWLGKKRIPGLANIGFRPTVKKEREQLIEVHLFNFKREIYGRDLRIVFLKKIRSEKKFPSKSLLIKQIQSDIKHARQISHI